MSGKRQQTLEVIAQVAGTPVTEIHPDMNLVADLGVDSPKALQLLVALEDALGIEISDEEAARLETVGDILAVTTGP
jgi:acyl carrier protein